MYEHHKKWKVVEDSHKNDDGSQVVTEVSAEGAGSTPALEQLNHEDVMIRYLISSKWWERWRDFTNFDQDFLFGQGDALQSRLEAWL